MKKLIILFALAVISVAASAQKLTYLGIPIDGNIKPFEKELRAKDYIPEVKAKNQKGTIRTFKGKYCGMDCLTHVYFTPKTKTVYSVALCIPGDDADFLQGVQENLAGIIAGQYTHVCSMEGESGGFKVHSLLMSASDNADCNTNLGFGTVDMFIKEYGSSTPRQYNLYIIFEDADGALRNEVESK